MARTQRFAVSVFSFSAEKISRNGVQLSCLKGKRCFSFHEGEVGEVAEQGEDW